jgi:hypothetical protein
VAFEKLLREKEAMIGKLKQALGWSFVVMLSIIMYFVPGLRAIYATAVLDVVTAIAVYCVALRCVRKWCLGSLAAEGILYGRAIARHYLRKALVPGIITFVVIMALLIETWLLDCPGYSGLYGHHPGAVAVFRAQKNQCPLDGWYTETSMSLIPLQAGTCIFDPRAVGCARISFTSVYDIGSTSKELHAPLEDPVAELGLLNVAGISPADEVVGPHACWVSRFHAPQSLLVGTGRGSGQLGSQYQADSRPVDGSNLQSSWLPRQRGIGTMLIGTGIMGTWWVMAQRAGPMGRS